MDQEAKQQLLDGDVHGAENTYLSAEELREDHQWGGKPGAYITFMAWLLETGDFIRGIRFFKDANWLPPLTRIAMARQLSDTLTKSGQRSRGLDLLRSLRPDPDAPDAHLTLYQLGKALWDRGETEEGIATMHEATYLCLATGENYVPQHAVWDSFDPNRTLIDLGKTLWAIGETKSGVEAIRGAAYISLARASRNFRLPLYGYS